MKAIDIIKTDHELSEGKFRDSLVGKFVSGFGDAILKKFPSKEEQMFADKVLKDYVEYSTSRKSIGAPVDDFETWIAPKLEKSESNRMVRGPDGKLIKPPAGEYADSVWANDPEFRKKIAEIAPKEIKTAEKSAMKTERAAKVSSMMDATKKALSKGKMVYWTGIFGYAGLEIILPAFQNFWDDEYKIEEWRQLGMVPPYQAGKQSTPAELEAFVTERHEHNLKVLESTFVAVVAEFLLTLAAGKLFGAGIGTFLPKVGEGAWSITTWNSIKIANQLEIIRLIVQDGHKQLAQGVWDDAHSTLQTDSEWIKTAKSLGVNWSALIIGAHATYVGFWNILKGLFLKACDVVTTNPATTAKNAVKAVGDYADKKYKSVTSTSKERVDAERAAAAAGTSTSNGDTNTGQTTNNPGADTSSTNGNSTQPSGPQPDPASTVSTDKPRTTGSGSTSPSGWREGQQVGDWIFVYENPEGSAWRNAKTGGLKMVKPGEQP